MATHTFGTSATSSLVAVTWLPGPGSGILPADHATIAANIRRQSSNANGQIDVGSFGPDGRIFLPGNRGVIKPNPGDIIAVDTASGWPIVVSMYAAANGPWTFV